MAEAARRLSVRRLDHLVITVRDLDATRAFYQRLLGMEVVVFGGGRTALHFGEQKIIFARRDGHWLATHTHFSLSPAG